MPTCEPRRNLRGTIVFKQGLAVRDHRVGIRDRALTALAHEQAFDEPLEVLGLTEAGADRNGLRCDAAAQALNGFWQEMPLANVGNVPETAIPSMRSVRDE